MSPTAGAARLAEARKALRCLFIAVDANVAADVQSKCEAAFAALSPIETTAGVPISDERSVAYLNWWYDVGRYLSEDVDAYEVAFEAGRALAASPVQQGAQELREAWFANLMNLGAACFRNEGEDADETLYRMRALIKESRVALAQPAQQGEKG